MLFQNSIFSAVLIAVVFAWPALSLAEGGVSGGSLNSGTSGTEINNGGVVVPGHNAAGNGTSGKSGLVCPKRPEILCKAGTRSVIEIVDGCKIQQCAPMACGAPTPNCRPGTHADNSCPAKCVLNTVVESNR